MWGDSIKRKYIISSLLVGTLAISSILLVSGSIAFFTSRDIRVNKFTTGDVKIEITEDFDKPDNWTGVQHDKKVRIKNLSKSNAFIRVSIIPRWVDENKNPWPGDTSFVEMEFVNIGTNWIKDNGSNYYYYNEIVETDQFTNDILASVSANVPEKLKDRYKGKTLIIDVNSEAVQASKDAHAKVWSDLQNKDIKNLLDGLCKY